MMLQHQSSSDRVHANQVSPTPRSSLRRSRSRSKSLPAVPNRVHRSGHSPKLVAPNPSYPILLDSSPIKNQSSPLKQAFLSSSPSKSLRKSVAFSDDLIQDSPSLRLGTPQRSILKTCDLQSHCSSADPNDTSQWSDQYGPVHCEFWLPGTVIQLQPHSLHFGALISGCISVLKIKSFSMRFEVYATINYSYKVNAREVTKELIGIGDFTDRESPSKASKLQQNRKIDFNDLNSVPQLIQLIHEDIVSCDINALDVSDALDMQQNTRLDPFKSRITSQALKLICTIFLSEELCNYVPITEAKWLYSRACSILQNPECSRPMALAYLLLFKECKFSASRKRALFDSSQLPENILKSLIGLASYSSSLVVCEKFLCFKSLVVNFPGIMAKNFHHWFGPLVLNLCSLSPQYYLKCIGVGINCIMEVAKVFLDNKVVHMEVRHFMESAIPGAVRSFSTESSFEEDAQVLRESHQLALSFLKSRLQLMIDAQLYRHAMDVWVALTLLVGSPNNGFDTWTALEEWLSVRRYCYENSNESDGRINAVMSGKAIIYNVCHDDFDDLKRILDPILRGVLQQDRARAVTAATTQKVRLLHEHFMDVDASRLDPQLVQSLHGIFLSILYSLVNPNVSRPKYLYLYWDKVIQPVLANFYTAKGKSTMQTHSLALEIVRTLLGGMSNTMEKSHNDLRCLAGSAVQPSEISALPPRWIFQNFERILHNLVVLFESEYLSDAKKMGILQLFLANVRFFAKKEKKPSDDTYDLADNLPFVVEKLLSHTELLPETLRVLVEALIGTFDINLFVNWSGKGFAASKEPPKMFSLILQNSILNLPSVFTGELFRLIAANLNTTELLEISLSLLVSNSDMAYFKRLVPTALAECLFGANEKQMSMCGHICKHISVEFEPFVKRFLQLIVVLSSASDVQKLLLSLNVHYWALPVFKYYLMLVHNAPSAIIRQVTADVLVMKAELEEQLVDLIDFLQTNKYFPELFIIKSISLTRAGTLTGDQRQEFIRVWTLAISEYVNHTNDSNQIDEMLAMTVELSDIECGHLVSTLKEKYPLLSEAFSRRDQRRKALARTESMNIQKDSAALNPDAVCSSPSRKGMVEENSSFLSAIQLAPSPESETITDLPPRASQESPHCDRTALQPGSTKFIYSSFTKRQRQKSAIGAAPILPHISDSFDINMYASMVAQQLNLSPNSRARQQSFSIPQKPAYNPANTSLEEFISDIENDSSITNINTLPMMQNPEPRRQAKGNTLLESEVIGTESLAKENQPTTRRLRLRHTSPHKRRKLMAQSSISNIATTPGNPTISGPHSKETEVRDNIVYDTHHSQNKSRQGGISHSTSYSDNLKGSANNKFEEYSLNLAPPENLIDVQLDNCNNGATTSNDPPLGVNVGVLAKRMDAITDDELLNLSIGTQSNLKSALSRFMYRVRHAVNASLDLP